MPNNDWCVCVCVCIFLVTSLPLKTPLCGGRGLHAVVLVIFNPVRFRFIASYLIWVFPASHVYIVSCAFLILHRQPPGDRLSATSAICRAPRLVRHSLLIRGFSAHHVHSIEIKNKNSKFILLSCLSSRFLFIYKVAISPSLLHPSKPRDVANSASCT